MEIKGLIEKLGLTGEQLERFYRMKVQTAVMTMNVIAKGGNIHGVNRTAAEKRHAKNKLARKQRKRNNG